jgi:hypothetical protein
MNKVTGLLLNAGVGASIDTVEITDLESIQNHVGGLIDAVRQPINDDIYVVGYVHDEGLILDLEMNWIASALFGREIRGSVVLVNGNNDVGEYDGYNHDLPNEFIEYMKTVFLARVATTYNESQIILALLQSAASDDIIEMEKLDELLEVLAEAVETGDRDATNKAGELMRNVLSQIDETMATQATDTLVDEIYDFLKEQN